MIAEKTTKHYINNNNLIDKTGVILVLLYLCWTENNFKTNTVLVCHGIGQSSENFQKKMAVVVLFIYETNQLQMFLL